MPTPTISAIATLVRAAQSKGDGSPNLSADALAAAVATAATVGTGGVRSN